MRSTAKSRIFEGYKMAIGTHLTKRQCQACRRAFVATLRMDFGSEEIFFSPQLQYNVWPPEPELGQIKPSDFVFPKNNDQFEFDAEALLDEIFNEAVNANSNQKEQKSMMPSTEIAISQIETADPMLCIGPRDKQSVAESNQGFFALPASPLDTEFLFEPISDDNASQMPNISVNEESTSETPEDLRDLIKVPVNRQTGRAFKPRPKGSKRSVQAKRVFDYTGIFISTTLEKADMLRNVAKNPCPEWFVEIYKYKLIKPLTKQQDEVCTIRRDRYIREDLETILGHLSNDVVYEKNINFELSRPYEPQYIRYIVDLDSPRMLPFNNTRAGLCAYCSNLQFFDIKTSAYAQHLALQHGVYTDNFLTPNPLLFGHYRIKKPENTNRKEKRKTQAHELERDGVVCPCCYEIIGVNCSKKTANSKPLTNYMRHFRDKHIYCRNKHDPYMYFNKFDV